MRFSFDEDESLFIPFNFIPMKRQSTLAKKITANLKEILDLEKTIKVKGFFKESNKEKENKQNLVDSILRISYPYISEGRSWSSIWTKLPPIGKLKIIIKPEFIPEGQKDKTEVAIGTYGDQSVKIGIWKSPDRYVFISNTTEVFSFENPEKELQINIPFQISFMLTSSGLSADWQGSRFGEYQLAGEHEGAVMYQQTHTVAGEANKLYRDPHGWRVGESFDDASLRNASKSDVPPKTGWECPDGKQRTADPALTLEFGSLPHCGQITISATGAAARKRSNCHGVFTQTEMVSAGRRIFRQKGGSKVLSCRPGDRGWMVRPSVESDAGGIASASSSVCPADSRAAINRSKNLSSWEYYDSGWKPGNITVVCSSHSK